MEQTVKSQSTEFLFIITICLLLTVLSTVLLIQPETACAGTAESAQTTQDIPEIFHSLVLLDKADSEFESGRTDQCRKTLNELESLDNLPIHHKLYAQQLKAIIDGKPDNALTHTAIPEFTKIAATVYVSQIGVSANGDGTQKAPFNSISDAVRHIRTLRRNPGLPDGALVISLLDESYTLKKPIVLTGEDSGTEKNPLVIRSGDRSVKTTLYGGCVLDSWHKVTDTSILDRLPQSSRDRILSTSLTEHGIPNSGEIQFGGFSSQRAIGGSHRFKTFPVIELFYMGKAQQMARWPNNEDTDMPLDKFTDSRLDKWQYEKDLWLHGYWYWAWADAYEKVKAVHATEDSISLEPPINRYGFRDSKWHAVNALYEIDMPGEWQLDVDSQTIYYLPPENFDPKECVISVYGPVLTAQGCNFISIENVDIQYVRGDALLFTDCNDISVSRCQITAASGYGIRIEGGLRYLLHTITITHMGRGGIDIVTGDWKELIPSGTVIENCTISDLSRIDRTYTPAIVMEGMGIKVRHCLFSQIPSSAIRMEASESLIELNEFTRCVEESDDQGAIDVWGNPLYRRNIIRWNYFHDNTGRHGMVCGVRLDDAISDFMISRNIFLRSSGGHFGGIQIHGGKDNYVDGNVIIDCQTGISNSPWGENWKERLSSHTGIAAHLASTPWQGPEWRKRYPELKDLVDGIPDRNFFAENHMINCEKDFIRMSPNALLYKNSNETTRISTTDLTGILAESGYKSTIPAEFIGIYK